VSADVQSEAWRYTRLTIGGGFARLNNTSTLFGQINAFSAPRRVQIALKLAF
jgi:uncharacterized protein YaaQ